MRSFAVALALAASAYAYTVTSPTNSTGWTTSGPNVVSWTKVSTDPQNFTIVLSNQASFPPTTQVLDALVDGSLGNTTVNPPSGGWKAGSGYQVNLVQDAQNLNAILAQSNQFTIKESSSSTFSSGSSSASSAASTAALSSAPGGTLTAPSSSNTGSSTPSGSGSGALNPSTSDTSTTPANNAALPAMGMQAGVWSVLALLGAMLA
ncbi:hypothetical protein CERSUDRAFT_91657 [Gelatoporia subvermispora B]|uniref:Yeast cell wall synthesis Kre9/Knh1-like N-terminal domain-containing protein n=1 Tax=Ceriporiopsis subvermispora (strain B) TaxID=914234 RepID=M2PVV3_CERS8|nr:hypothetical protein CERSUDRAFT_91657 [Gelatoporia subvermispora B]